MEGGEGLSDPGVHSDDVKFDEFFKPPSRGSICEPPFRTWSLDRLSPRRETRQVAFSENCALEAVRTPFLP